MSIDPKIVDRIRKLEAKGNDTSVTVEEATLFLQKAEELRLQHNVSRAMLNEGQREAKDIRTHKVFTTLVRPYSSTIISGITKLYYCKWYYDAAGSRKHRVTLIGEESNVAMCHVICLMVLRAVEGEARRTGGGRSFMTGASQTIWRRCNEMYQATHGTLSGGNSSTEGVLLTAANRGALVVLDQSEQARNQQYMEATLGIKTLRQVKSRAQIRDRGALGAGRQFGETVNLRSNLLGRG